MTQFIQLHLLTAYPPSNPNRDDTGRPKTAIVGGALRQRISSQALKRAWRTSDIFESSLKGYLGKRTRCMGIEVMEKLIKRGVAEEKALETAQRIAEVFGKRDGNSVEIKQPAHFAPEEMQAIDSLVEKIAKSGKLKDTDLDLLREKHKTADIALFGRMLADAQLYNMEAACQVSNALTVHKIDLDDDFFTAVDDLNKRGSAYMGETGFASGLYYLYLCIDTDRLKENLRGDVGLAKTTLQVLLEAAATVAPSGMQNRFGSRVCASYILAELGTQQPRNLSVAFFNPIPVRIPGSDLQTKAIEEMEKTCAKMDEVYGPRAHQRKKVSINPKTDKEPGGKKQFVIEDAETLATLKQFVCRAYDV